MYNLWLKIKKKILRYSLACFILILLITFFIHLYNIRSVLEVDFLDVGQGDAILIKTPSNEAILIDGGPDNKVLWRLGENLSFYQRRIDYLILSHYHDDHAVGLIEILKRYRVGHLIYAGGISSSPVITELLDIAQSRKVELIPLDGEFQVSYGNDCRLDLLNPFVLGVKDDPNNSLVARLSCVGRTFLFSGDNSQSVEKILINSDWDIRADILKSSHHGSNSANSELFLRAVNPQFMVISVGADNRFGHPSPRIIELASVLGIDVKRTDESGSVKFLANKSL